MSDNKNKLYLVGCDDVPVEGLAGYEKIEITLKPAQNFVSKALDVLNQTSPGSEIAVSGTDCVAVLKAQVLAPNQFKRIILIEPGGAFWWEDAKNKPEEYFDAFDLFDNINCKVDVIGKGKDIPAWSSILKNADISLNWKDVPINLSDDNAYLELARLSGIKVSYGKEFLVKGKSYTRTLSSDIEWEEPGINNSDKKKSSRSIISSLGWQWEKHWNVYTEAAPFGLMLSMLNEFLIECIRIFHYRPMYIEWAWDGEEYSLTNIYPADDYRFLRAVGNEIESEVGNDIWNILSLLDRNIMRLNEPYLIQNRNSHLNLDALYACANELGIRRKFVESFETKFDLFRYLKSLPKILSLNLLNKVLDEQETKIRLISDNNVKESVRTLLQERKRIIELLFGRE